MREILFRGKQFEFKNNRIIPLNWVEGFYYDNKTHRLRIYDEQSEKYCYKNFPYILVYDKHFGQVPTLGNMGSPVFLDVISETVGQYTGLTDKNGKKIFEGDIVDFDIRGEDESYGVVKYSNEETEFYITFDNSILGLGRNFYSQGIEVIGNIHDTPELI
jgi:hypothetical protein